MAPERAGRRLQALCLQDRRRRAAMTFILVNADSSPQRARGPAAAVLVTSFSAEPLRTAPSAFVGHEEHEDRCLALGSVVFYCPSRAQRILAMSYRVAGDDYGPAAVNRAHLGRRRSFASQLVPSPCRSSRLPLLARQEDMPLTWQVGAVFEVL